LAVRQGYSIFALASYQNGKIKAPQGLQKLQEKDEYAIPEGAKVDL
jgi:hypothetical protein